MDTTLQYVAYVRKEGRRHLIEFPDAPGCQTFADREADIYSNAKEAIEGFVMVLAEHGQPIPVENQASAHLSVNVEVRMPAGA